MKKVTSIEEKKAQKQKKIAKNRFPILEAMDFTELKMARRFMQLEENDGNWIYNKTRKKWMFWNAAENIWTEDSESMMYKKVAEFVENLSIQFQHWFNELEDKEWNQVERALVKMQTAQGLRGIMNCCMTEAKVISETDLDSDPNIINFKNGFYSLKTNSFYDDSDITKGFYMTKRCNVDYIEGSLCELWEKTLDEIFMGDAEYMDYIQRIFGYALLGKDNEHAVFMIQGDGRNGKGTFFSMIKKIMGMYYYQVPYNGFTTKGKDNPLILADLYAMRFALVSETDKNTDFAISLLKSISGGDTVSGRRHHELYFQYKPSYKVFIETNHLPNIDNDQAMWERMHTIKFERYFAPEERDTRLSEKLESELSGILMWLIEGWKKYQERGLTKPLKAIEDTQAHRDENDYLKMFIDNCFNLTADENDYVMGDDLFLIYCEWADHNRINAKERLNGIQFGKEIKKRKGILFKSKRIELNGVSKPRKVYVGMEYIEPKERG